MATERDEDIIERVQDFLKRSSEKYSKEIKKQCDDLEAYNGNFWTDELKKTYHRTSSKKLCLHFSDWSVLANAAAAPYADSPWHTALINREGDNITTQNTINGIENESDIKSACKEGFLRGIICGAGFGVITTDGSSPEDVKIQVKFIYRQDSVALDPDIETPDASDAEAGALVNYISIQKAKRLYGNDIVPNDYPRAQPKLNFTGIKQWENEVNKIQEVNYYEKNSKGGVTYYKICGNKVIKTLDIPIGIIPIVRFAGYAKYGCDGIRYSGIVDKTYDLQLGLNIAYSTLMERANRSIKANLIASTKAVEGLDPYYKKMTDEDGMMILYNEGTAEPKPLIEQFQTADLRDVINQTRELIADVVGIPLSGIIGINDKTATEVLVQKSNQQSNVSVFYDHAYKANRTIARIIIQMLNKGSDILFELENGPDVITNNMKKRQELQAIASLIPQNLQPIIAAAMCDAISSDSAENLKANIIANSKEIQFISNKETDPYAINELNKMKAMIEQTMAELEKAKTENIELNDQLKVLNLQMLNTKEDRILEYQKIQNEYNLKSAELGIKNSEVENKTMVDIQKIENEKNKIIVQAMK